MKKTKRSALLLMLTLLCGIFILASCAVGGPNNGGTSAPTKLTAPTVSLTGDVASWDTNPLADRLEISLDGNLSYIESSVTSKKLSDGQTFKIRAIGDGTKYTNSDWSNSVTYHKSTAAYTVTWKNGDTVLEVDTGIIEGTVPTYDGTEPTRAATAQYTYRFSGWSPAVMSVTGDVTYHATFTSVLNRYTVVWKSGDAVLETDEEVAFGTTPSYDSAEPTRAPTAQFTYRFSGWSPEIQAVNTSTVYQAQFAEETRRYTVTFRSEDGATVLASVTVPYGSAAVYPKSQPTKNATAEASYLFDGWTSVAGGSEKAELSRVDGDKTVYASFKAAIRTVTVYVVPNNANYGKTSVTALENVPYGAQITLDGNTVIVNGQTVTAQASEGTAEYSYTFTGWSADTTVGSDTIITAVFSRSLNSYSVTWKNGETVLEVDESVPYGTAPIYNGATPVKAATQAENIFSAAGLPL